jgi:hypothetical protein
MSEIIKIEPIAWAAYPRLLSRAYLEQLAWRQLMQDPQPTRPVNLAPTVPIVGWRNRAE